MKIGLTLVLLILSSSVHAAKLYKIVDENGRVTFSQYPPPEKAATAKQVQINNTGGMTAVTGEGRYLKCGSVKLPNKSSYYYKNQSTLRHQENLQYYISRWHDQLNYLEDRTTPSNSKYRSDDTNYQNQKTKRYNERLRRDMGKMRDLRCAINWAQNNREENKEKVENLTDEKQRLNQVKDKLQTQLDRKCGELPVYDPTDSHSKKKRKEWYACSYDLRKDLDQLENKIKRL